MIDKLNDQQAEAVTYPLAPVMVMAGAGTGKTTILTKRIAFLIYKYNLKPYEILAITFTNKAAEEMNSRIRQEIGQPLEWIGTFHSICVRILRSEIGFLGRSSNFKIVDDEDCKTILKGIYEELKLDKNKLSYKTAQSIIDIIKTNMYDLDDLNSYDVQRKLKIDNDQVLWMVKMIYQRYIKKFEDYNYLDFNDLLNFTNLIFENNPEARIKWGQRFKYILVDEFQDTNPAQYQLIEYLGGEKFNIFAVGDEDQIIYSFRGADSTVIDRFVNHFEGKRIPILKLEENYRSTNQILYVANDLIAKNKGRVTKNLFSFKQDHIKPIVHQSLSNYEEGNFVANKIAELIKEGVEPKEIVILYRSNHLSRTYEQALIYNDIQYNLYGGFKFYQRSEIKDILAYLQVINDYDEISLLRIINIPRRKISDATVKILLDHSVKYNLKLWESLVKADQIDELTTAQKNAIKQFVQLIELFKNQDQEDIATFFDFIVDTIKYYDYAKTVHSVDKLEIIERNLDELKNSILNFKARRANKWSLNDYLNEIALFTSLDDKKKHDNAVTLMTIHAAKGLEFGYVFLVNFNDGVFPSKYSLSEHNGLTEERRLAYVAITRAKKELYICWNTDYNGMEGKNNVKSRFLNEIKNDLVQTSTPKFIKKSNLDLDWFDSHQKVKLNKEELYNDDQENTYKIGDHLSHVLFGEGVVIGINGNILEISFKPPYKIKNIIYNHKSIKRQIK